MKDPSKRRPPFLPGNAKDRNQGLKDQKTSSRKMWGGEKIKQRAVDMEKPRKGSGVRFFANHP